jgi:maleate isomerase
MTTPTLGITPAAHAIGIMLPSSNRVVERVTLAMLADLSEVDACFTRVPYGGHPADGYDLPPFEAAAVMLSQARVQSICWNATRGAGLGFEPDRRLCGMITERTGLPSTTTALATLDLLRSLGLERIALLSQGSAAEGERVADRFGAEGITVVAGPTLGITDNFQAALVPPDQLRRRALEAVAAAKPDAVLFWSTNLPGFGLMADLERETGIPALDSTAVGTLAALRPTGVDLAPLTRFGRMFS